MRVAATCGVGVPKNFPGSPGAIPGGKQLFEDRHTLNGMGAPSIGFVHYYPERNNEALQSLFTGSERETRRFLEGMEAGCKIHQHPFAVQCEKRGGNVVMNESKMPTCSFMRRADRPKKEDEYNYRKRENEWKAANHFIKGLLVDVDAENHNTIRYYAVVRNSSHKFQPDFGHSIIETDEETFSEWMKANAIRPMYYDDNDGVYDINDNVFSDGIYFSDDPSDNYDALISFYRDLQTEPGATLTWNDKVEEAIESISKSGTKYGTMKNKGELDALSMQLNVLYKNGEYKQMTSEINKFIIDHLGNSEFTYKEVFTRLPRLLERPIWQKSRSYHKVDPEIVKAGIIPDPHVLQHYYTIEGAETYIKDHEDNDDDIKKVKNEIRKNQSKLKKAREIGDEDDVAYITKDIENNKNKIERLGEVPRKIEIARASIDNTIAKSLEAADYTMLSRVDRQKLLDDKPWDLH